VGFFKHKHKELLWFSGIKLHSVLKFTLKICYWKMWSACGKQCHQNRCLL